MTLAFLQVILQSISSTLHWLGFSFGVCAASHDKSQQRHWIIGAALVSALWLVSIVVVGADNVFQGRAIPATLLATLAAGYLLLLSPTFRGSIAAIPQHWLIAIQTFRIVGGVFLVRYFAGQLPGIFAIPAGVGDVVTGLLAPLVAYWWFVGRSYARGAAIAWNLFGMADLINAVAIGALTGAGGGIVFPIVLIPIYGVPRAFLIHSYSLIGLLRQSSPRHEPRAALRYGFEAS